MDKSQTMWKMPLLLGLLVSLPLVGQVTPAYKVKDLGVLRGWAGSTGVRSNWIGQVTGRLVLPTGSAPADTCHAYIWNLFTGMRDIGSLGGACALGMNVDALGRVGGRLVKSGDETQVRAFYWTFSTGMVDIGSLAGSSTDGTFLQSMNNRGEIVGASQQGGYNPGNSPYERAFYWSRATGIKDLGSLAGVGAGESSASAINDSGKITGISNLGTVPPSGQHAVYWNGPASPIVDLAVRFSIPGDSRAFQINNRNQIAGDRIAEDGSRVGIFVADPNLGPVIEMGNLGFLTSGIRTQSRSMNEAGQVVGDLNLGSSFSDQDHRGFRWTPPGSGPAVMEQIPPLAGDSHTSAYAINPRGEVAGISYANGPSHPFFWTPATGTVALPALVSGKTCVAVDINEFGLITGQCLDSANNPHAVVWARGLIGLLFFP